MAEQFEHLRRFIRDIPDWPKQGIIFRDITPLLADSEGFVSAVHALSRKFEGRGIEYVAAVEARGFIFGGAVAEHLGAGFIPIRKKGKLPWEHEAVSYELEYGTDTLEIHKDAIKAGAKVLLVDDLMATGGSMAASCKLIERIGGEVAGISFLIELSELKGRQQLGDYEVYTVLKY